VIHKGAGAVRQGVGHCVAEQVQLVAEEDAAPRDERGLPTQVGKADLGSPVEGGGEDADAVGNRPQVGAWLPREVVLGVEVQARQARAQRSMHVAPVGGEVGGGQPLPPADIGV